MAWASIGRCPEQFWRLTLRQVHHVFQGEGERQFQQFELAYYVAWHSGLFSQSYSKGKFPKYEKSAPKRKIRGGISNQQTWQQQKLIAKTLTAALGGSFN